MPTGLTHSEQLTQSRSLQHRPILIQQLVTRSHTRLRSIRNVLTLNTPQRPPRHQSQNQRRLTSLARNREHYLVINKPASVINLKGDIDHVLLPRHQRRTKGSSNLTNIATKRGAISPRCAEAGQTYE
jgi:hypothetical protein